MDQSREELLQRFKRMGFVLVMVPALIVAALVVFGVRQVQVMSYGRMISTGLNGIGAASMRQGASVDDPAVLKDFRTNFNSLAAQGSFGCISLVSLDGEIIASTHSAPCASSSSGIEALPRVMERDRAFATITSGEDRQLLVAAPLRLTPDQEPYAGVVATRPYSLVGPFMNAVSVAIAVVVLLGGLLSYTLLRLFIRRAEHEIEAQMARADLLSRRLSASLHDIEEQSIGTLRALVAAVDAKDSYTARHSMNVADYAVAVAAHMGHDELLAPLERAGLLHDIGKIGVPESLLDKAGALDAEEYAAVQEHAMVGAEIVTTVPFLHDIVPIVRHHHEHVDGSGYPDGISGDDIPLAARVLSVADAFDAMTTERPYRGAVRPPEAVAELLACAGSQFDSDVVEAFAEAVARGRVHFRGDVV